MGYAESEQFFFVITSNIESVFNSFPNLFDREDEVDITNEGAIAENNRMIKEAFNKRWGWHELSHNVSEYLFISMLECMKLNVMEVLMYATLLKEKVDIIKK